MASQGQITAEEIIKPTFRTLKNELLAQLLLACWMNQ